MSLGPNPKEQLSGGGGIENGKNRTSEGSGARAGDVSGPKPQSKTKWWDWRKKLKKWDPRGVRGKGERCLQDQTLRHN